MIVANHKTNSISKNIKNLSFITLGAALVSIALEVFFVPNGIIDGGVVGTSMMLSHIMGLPLGILLVILNIPFFVLGYKQIGKTFALSTIVAIVLMSIGVQMLHDVSPFTKDPLLAAIFGGILLGVGVGAIIKYGGSTDGVEISAILIAKKTPFSVGEVVMIFNFFILASSGFVFGWDKAMYSIISYFIAYKMIDVVIEGLDESRSAWIISDNAIEIGEAIQARLGRTITYMDGTGGYSAENKKIIFCVITRLEEAKLKTIIEEKDSNAFFTLGHASEVQGGNFKKKDIH
ncbi:MAG: rane protein [Bacillales bacterium]|jgi:uncharacterized membrane-anchored protein YitT (DUF2179 family)|nr:rane protein [Bacillales bacterium]